MLKITVVPLDALGQDGKVRNAQDYVIQIYSEKKHRTYILILKKYI